MKPAELPNILFIHSHDTGRYIQPYGHAVPTPNLQRLAEQGTLFRQAFSAAPTCSPSRACLLSGMWPHNSGMLGLAHRGFSLSNPERTLMQVLKRSGYETALAGVQHIANDPRAVGFDRVLDKANNHADSVASSVAEYLRSPHERPFFAFAGFFETHRVFPSPTPEDDSRYTLPPLPLVDTPETRKDMSGFKASARAMDQGVGTILEALDASGQAGNTLIIYTTDHGIAFPKMKCNLTDHGLGVSLIMRGPGGFDGGAVYDAMVSQIDLFPTLCDLAGVERPSWLQGTSILPLVRDESARIRDELFGEVTYHAAYEPQRCVRTRRWKYIRRFDDRESPVLPNCDDSPSKSVLLDAGWRSQPRPREMLYDLMFDPVETDNLADLPQHEPVLREMRSRLDRWMRETDDPLLEGVVSLPAGARATEPDSYSP